MNSPENFYRKKVALPGREQELSGRLHSLLSSHSQTDELQVAIDLADGRLVAPGNNAIGEAINSSREKQQALSIGIEKQEHNIQGIPHATACSNRRLINHKGLLPLFQRKI